MNESESELVKISTLQERYGLESRQAVYDRINGLDIKPVARGKISFEQLELLDKLDKHLKDGGTIGDFPIQPEIELMPLERHNQLDTLDNSLDIIDDQIDNSEVTAINAMAGLVEKMMGLLAGNKQSSTLAEYEELEKAITNRWILSTGKVRELTGITPKVGKDGLTFIWGSFIFTKAGKIGNQMGWLVTKTLD